MNSICVLAMLVPLCLTQVIDISSDHSQLYDTECGLNCAKCWKGGKLQTNGKCALCKDGYFFAAGFGFDSADCLDTFDQRLDGGHAIVGFKRGCAICKKRNYVDSTNNCRGCLLGCDTCNQDPSGKCTACISGPTIDDNFILSDGICTCALGGHRLVDEYCKCNNKDKYINEDFNCVTCDECHRDQANCASSTFAQIKPRFFDRDLIGCPGVCHESCYRCVDDTDTGCQVSEGLRECDNENLWEEVPKLSQCFCVCKSKTIQDPITGRFRCECEANRVKTDTCANKSCTSAELKARYQCLCDASKGYSEGQAGLDGVVPCVLQAR